MIVILLCLKQHQIILLAKLVGRFMLKMKQMTMMMSQISLHSFLKERKGSLAFRDRFK
jgi:hypothetical protein